MFMSAVVPFSTWVQSSDGQLPRLGLHPSIELLFSALLACKSWSELQVHRMIYTSLSKYFQIIVRKPCSRCTSKATVSGNLGGFGTACTPLPQSQKSYLRIHTELLYALQVYS